MGLPMSFMMMSQDSLPNPSDNGLVGVPMNGGNGMLPINMPSNVNTFDSFATMTATTPAPIIVNNIQPTVAPPPTNSNTSATSNNQSSPAAASMMLPTMTMIFQSEPGGNSAIELNMLGSNMANSTNAALLQRPSGNGNRWIPQQQQEDQFDEPAEQQSLGEQYYSSPWTNRAPLASPAKVFRGERLRAQQQQPRPVEMAPISARQQLQPHHQQQQASSQQTSVVVGQVPANAANQPQMPVLLIKNRWRSQQNGNLNLPVAILQHQQQQAVNQALEYEELVPIGPPQMMPVYQTPNGQIHMSPPPPVMIQPAQAPARVVQVQPPPQESPRSSQSSQLEREEGTSSGRIADFNSEVSTTNGAASPVVEPIIESQRNIRPQSVQTSKTSSNGKLASPAVKGKQQQQKTNQKPASSAGSGY